MEMTTYQIVSLALSLLSLLGVGAFISKKVGNKVDKMNEDMQARSVSRKQESIFTLRGILAVGELSEATSTAIKNGKCNGETDKAREKYNKYKEDLNDFLIKENANNLYKN